MVEGGSHAATGTWERLAPLTGLVFVAIAVIAFAIGGSTPGDHDTAQQVQDFYGKHHDKHMLLSFILALSIPFLLFFVSSLRYELRRAGGTGQLANAAFGGGVLAAAGFGILAFVHLALADAAGSANTIGTAQVLNVLDNNDFIPVAAGVGVLMLAAGMSAVRHGGLPKWLGWAAVVIGVLAFTPAGFFAFLASGIWIAIASILLTQGAPVRRTGPGRIAGDHAHDPARSGPAGLPARSGLDLPEAIAQAPAPRGQLALELRDLVAAAAHQLELAWRCGRAPRRGSRAGAPGPRRRCATRGAARRARPRRRPAPSAPRARRRAGP